LTTNIRNTTHFKISLKSSGNRADGRPVIYQGPIS